MFPRTEGSKLSYLRDRKHGPRCPDLTPAASPVANVEAPARAMHIFVASWKAIICAQQEQSVVSHSTRLLDRAAT